MIGSLSQRLQNDRNRGQFTNTGYDFCRKFFFLLWKVSFVRFPGIPVQYFWIHGNNSGSLSAHSIKSRENVSKLCILKSVQFSKPPSCRFMEHRKPFKLKTFMVCYNIYQVVACIYVIKTMWQDEELPPQEYFSKCTQAKCFVKHPKLYNFTSVVYWLKASEMLETFVFVLRKKHNQISFLHVFHHCATITMSYLGGYSGQGDFLEQLSRNLIIKKSFYSEGSLLGHLHQLFCSYYHVQLLLSRRCFKWRHCGQIDTNQEVHHHSPNGSVHDNADPCSHQ